MHFFFYGTLIGGSVPVAARGAHARLRDRGPATAPGVLYALPDPLGWYPALLRGEGMVRGRLYEAAAGFSDADLASLDRYEGAEYRRRTIAVSDGKGEAVSAEAYVFARPVPEGGRPIAGGDFHAWLADHGVRPFGSDGGAGL